jgi:Domain of unknown function (DUF4424)
MRWIASAVLSFVAFAGSGLANDSTAELGAGGLVLVRADSVRMAKEELFISAKAVTVDYVFMNESEQDQTYLVAFPMPMIEPQDYMESDVSIPEQDRDNFMNFTVKANGQTVSPDLEMRALTAGLDITDALVALGVPLNPLQDKTRSALAGVPVGKLAGLIAKGAVVLDGDKPVPGWSLKATYYWQQPFIHGQPTLIKHSYVPAVGSGFYYESSNAKDRTYERFCLDDGTRRAIRTMAKTTAAETPYLGESRISYVLTSGANWAGPIGEFRLVVDKVSPDTIVSFCMDGVKKISATQFEVRKTEFTPDKDLAILLVRKPQP